MTSHAPRSRSRRALRAGAAVATLPLTWLLFATTSAEAAAPTVSVANNELTFTAAAGQQNQISITPLAGGKVRLDDVFDLTAGAGCTELKGTAVSCTGFTYLKIATGDGNDTITKTVNMSSSLDGGADNDTIHAGPAPGHAEIDIRPNTLRGGPGNDKLYGGVSNDELDGGPGKDLLNGGDGPDLVTYETVSVDVFVDLDGESGDDGPTGEQDTVGADVEYVVGGSGNDTLTGAAGYTFLAGGAGNDKLSGLGGEDSLYGGPGNDTLLGGADGDSLRAGPGENTIDGGAGNDWLHLDDLGVTSATVNTVTGGADNDQILNGPGADDITGGSGTDTVRYESHKASVIVDFDSELGDDGSIGEGDTVRADVENINGTNFDDVLTLSAANNSASAGKGHDVVRGLGGDDTLHGSWGDDTLSGGAGEDYLHGNEGDDVLAGGADRDDLYGEAGDDVLQGGAGNDAIIGGPNGFDVADGGTHFDGCYVSNGVAARCESAEPSNELVGEAPTQSPPAPTRSLPELNLLTRYLTGQPGA